MGGRYALTRIHPLLASVVALEGAGAVALQLSPCAMHVPAEGYAVRMPPLKLRLRGSPLVRGALSLLKINPSNARQVLMWYIAMQSPTCNSRDEPALSWHHNKENLAVRLSRRSPTVCVALVNECRGGEERAKGRVEAWTSAIEAQVFRTGEVRSKRMDVLLSRDFRVSKGEIPLHDTRTGHWGHALVCDC